MPQRYVAWMGSFSRADYLHRCRSAGIAASRVHQLAPRQDPGADDCGLEEASCECYWAIRLTSSALISDLYPVLANGKVSDND
jgi:hypothetical protein